MDFDEKAGDDLLQLLMDVFSQLDERNQTTVRDVDREALASTIINFMDLLKYNFKQTDLCVSRRAVAVPYGAARSPGLLPADLGDASPPHAALQGRNA